MIPIHSRLAIPEDELVFITSRSSGPGGQNVNKVESRVTLLFDVDASPTLSEAQKRRLHARLPNRINREGILRVVAQRHRTQGANRDEAVERFAQLLAEALHREAPRRATHVPAGARRRRLAAKRQRGETKAGRGRWKGEE